MEDEYGNAPPHGILRYGTVEHEIEYNEELKHLVLEKIEDMRGLEKSGEAHRNHNRPGKCRSCSRRNDCPEKLV